MTTEDIAKFSVLMSVYGSDVPEHFEIAINSVFDQSLRPDQVVLIVDGGVSERLDEMIFRASRRYSNLEVYRLEVNSGLAKALNFGIKKCANNYIARMDADDYSLPDRFKTMLPLMDDSIGMIGAVYEVYDEELLVKIGLRRLPLEENEIREYAMYRTPINHPTVVLNKQAVETVGGYPEAIGRFEDWGLALRLMQNGFSIRNIEDIVLLFRGGPDMIARRQGLRYALEEYKAISGLYEEGLIPKLALLKNTIFRFPLRILPKNVVIFLYRFLHKL